MTNGTMLQGFSWYLPADGSHWCRLAEQAPTFAYEGITAVWLPPAYKAEKGDEDVGYGVYDTYDLGEFDQKGSVRTKYGTRAEYEAAVRALQENGIQALADIVLNQRLGADGCEDVLAQINAAKSALHKVALFVAEDAVSSLLGQDEEKSGEAAVVLERFSSLL